MGLRLAVETIAARAVGAVSRAAGRGGGTTLPGKLLWKLDPPGLVDALAARLSSGVALISATNGKTTTTAMAAKILGDDHRLAWNRAGANLLSGLPRPSCRVAMPSLACSRWTRRFPRRSGERDRTWSRSETSS